jgi:hypothetical protein
LFGRGQHLAGHALDKLSALQKFAALAQTRQLSDDEITAYDARNRASGLIVSSTQPRVGEMSMDGAAVTAGMVRITGAHGSRGAVSRFVWLLGHHPG